MGAEASSQAGGVQGRRFAGVARGLGWHEAWDGMGSLSDGALVPLGAGVWLDETPGRRAQALPEGPLWLLGLKAPASAQTPGTRGKSLVTIGLGRGSLPVCLTGSTFSLFIQTLTSETEQCHAMYTMCVFPC